MVDGALLLRIDEDFARETLDIKHILRRKRLIRLVKRLNEHLAAHKTVFLLFTVYCWSMMSLSSLPYRTPHWMHWMNT